jgi:multiple antibiotic resistance protein
VPKLHSGEFSKKTESKKVRDAFRNDIALTPLAIRCLLDQDLSPVIAFYSEHQHQIIISVVAMVAVAIAIFIVLRSAHYLAKLLAPPEL